jgi:predicted NUDIX family NTP pyrophosphohydrolase
MAAATPPTYSYVKQGRIGWLAAGVLIYTHFEGRCFMLFGKERREHKGRLQRAAQAHAQGAGWCFMVGKVDKGERAIDAAAREMHEESCGVFSTSCCSWPPRRTSGPRRSPRCPPRTSCRVASR